MSSCEQFSWEVVVNSLQDEAGGVWHIEIHEILYYKVFGSIVLEGYCRVLLMPRSFVIASAQMYLPDWLYFPLLCNLLADFFLDIDREWMFEVLSPFTNRRSAVTHLVWVMDFDCAIDGSRQMLKAIDAHFKRKKCLFLIDKESFDTAVWESFASVGFDDMEGSRFGVCGRFFLERGRRLKVWRKGE